MQSILAPHPFRSAQWSIALIALSLGGPVLAQAYKPGDVIEYKVAGAVPEKWERGVIIRELDGGKQYLIHEKPSQFFPDGPEKAYAPSELRAVGNQNMDSKVTPDRPAPSASSTTAGNETTAADKNLLSRADVVTYAKRVFGPGDPFADGLRRDANLDKIRDYIKSRGTNFLPDDTFKLNEMPRGTYSVHIGSAIEANYGKAPKLNDYFGTFLLRTTNRGTKTTTKVGTRIILTTTDAQFEAGALVINEDGTYVWKISRTDPEAKWVKGKWREVKADEMQPWEGGPAIWLEKARQNEDYMVRMCRVPGYDGWIDVGMGRGRIAASYGRRP
jgi:hypothetical protein